MRRALLFTVIWMAGASAATAATAYEALRALGEAKGSDILHQVVEVAGERGAPQPEVWKIVTADPFARGGIRVFELRGTSIASERTPVARQAGEPVAMDFGRLNLDSSGAFDVVEQEAVRDQIGFDSLDYVLHAGGHDRTPVWAVQLVDVGGRPVGYYEIAADTGAVRAGGRASGRAGRQSNVRRRDEPGDYHVDEREEYRVVDEREEYRARDHDEGEGGFVGKIRRFGNRVERHFRRDGAAIERFFTGRSTVGPDPED